MIDPTDKRDSYLRKTYGITQRTYLAILRAQGGKCFICRRAPKNDKWLHIDHVHKSGQVRGALCWVCNNKFLGRYRENPEMHRRAVEYLNREYDWRNHPTARNARPKPAKKTS